ncbi:MAG: PAS domain S-box protein [Nitrospirota bacterium]
MNDEEKSKEQLIAELKVLRRAIAEREAAAAEQQHNSERLRTALAVAEEERARLETVLGSIGTGITIIDAHFKILSQNQFHKDLMGSHVGEHCYKAYQQRDNICEDCQAVKTFADGNVRTVVKQYRAGNEIRYNEVTASPLRDAGGNIVAVIEIVKDITERKRLEEDLKREKKFTESALSILQDLFYVVDQKGRFLLWNKRVNEVTGYSDEEIAVMRPAHFVSAEDAPRIAAATERVMNHGEATAEVDVMTKSGKRIPYELKGSLLVDHNGTIMGIAGTGRDITERRKADESLREEKNKLEAVLTAIGDGITVQDTSFRILYQNDIHKAKQGDHAGEYCYRAYQHRDSICEGCLLVRVFEDGRLHRRETSAVTDKGTIYLEVTATPLRDAKGSIIAGIEVVRDITERKRTEEKITFLASIIQTIPEAVCSIDLEGTIRSWNEGAERMLGYSADEVLGKPIALIIPEDMVQSEMDHCLNTLNARGFLTGYETIRISKQGRPVPVEMTAVVLRDKEGAITGYASIMRDITERKRLEEEHLKTEKLESLSILAGGIAHDFNNLLTSILGNLSLAALYVMSDDKAHERLKEAERASLRAKDLTQQLLTFSKGGVPIKKIISLGTLIRESAGFALRGANVRCAFSIPEGLWTVSADEGQISQVIHNLVLNAQQAMPMGGTIKIEGKNTIIKDDDKFPLAAGNYVKITVRDQGIGIPKEHLQNIFDPYFTTKQGGSGLGLATVYSIIRKHGGSIAVESEPGKGATFYLYLPAATEAAAAPDGKERGAFTGKGRVLVMDDEEIIRDVSGAMLRSMGYSVEYARDGEEAIDLYKRARASGDPFDVVVMDLTIPGGMGGKEAMARLREIDPAVKAIVSSGYSNDPVMAHYKEYGFAGMVIKPYRIQELSETVYRVTRGLM